ncbi:helix-turn-helix domain-containing protein [Pseudomonas saliphila]|uniref:helix-turn-helix domain-containing protein n=1 Tax=Pseudomonas saliphila TaxID=2586906 RepID=UPI00123C2EAB|nr:helix-turn-helix domain-containing protein [Pseudomonas saliphila]
MFAADAAVASPIQCPPSGGTIGRSYSSSAACITKARSRFLVGESQANVIDGGSIQTRIGAMFESSLPYGVTGLLRRTPTLIITVDGNPAELTRNIVAVQLSAGTGKEIAAISFKAQIENVQDQLGLSITQIAQLFGVTRKTVYDWLDNAAPRANALNRMEFVTDLIRQNESRLNLKRLKGVWQMTVNGSSFIDIVLDEELDQDSRMAAAMAKLEELAPRLGRTAHKLGKTYLGNAHANDMDRVADLG